MEGFNPSRTGASLPKGYARYVNNRLIDAAGPSPAGQTWNGGLGVPLRLQPGEQGTATFVISWHFPNRYLNFDQSGRPRDRGKSRFFLGNDYTNRFIDAVETAEYIAREHVQLREQTKNWEAVVSDTTCAGLGRRDHRRPGQPDALARRPSGPRTAGSTALRALWARRRRCGTASFGGSCPLNCTHVWNYEMALSRLFPDARADHARDRVRDMPRRRRATSPTARSLPLYLTQLWDEPIGGPAQSRAGRHAGRGAQALPRGARSAATWPG